VVNEPDLYPHQREAVSKLRNGNILKGGVGSGKSRAALAYYVRLAPWIKLYIITTAKKRDSGDWQEEAKLFGVEAVVDSWNNLMAYETVKDGFFIFDEQRVVGSGVWVQAFVRLARQNQWILLSATPGDTWLDYIPVFVANGFYKNRTEFIREHVKFSSFTKYPKVERYLGVARLVEHLREITVEMPFERHTTRHVIDVFVEHDRELFNRVWVRRWNYMADRPVRHISEMFNLARRVVGTDPSRLERIRDLLVLHPRIIVFYNFDYELEILRGLKEGETCLVQTGNRESGTITTGGDSMTITRTAESSGSTSMMNSIPGSSASECKKGLPKTGESSGPITLTAEEPGRTLTMSSCLGSFAVAEWNGHKHEPVPATESWVYLVQYASGAEGWNCTETDTVVFYSLTYSHKQFEQGKGRIDRVNTSFSDLYYYVFKSASIIDDAVYKSLMEKKDFSEARFMRALPHSGRIG
jgi:hypothetical protein